MVKPFNGSYRLTQGFGENPSSYAKFGMKGHNGLDYGTPTGTEILAPHSGKVLETSNDPTGYGLYVKIENDKEGSVLAHLREFSVFVGQVVKEGQRIGFSDNTGNSTGPHLHWGYYRLPRNRQNGYAGYINQLPLIGGVSMTNYKGYDLDNKESMKVAVDVLVRLQAGEFVDKAKYNADIKAIQDKLTACENRPVNTADTQTLSEVKTTFKKLHALLG